VLLAEATLVSSDEAISLAGTSFDHLKAAPVELEGPTSVVQGTDVTHLRYRVRKTDTGDRR
jgi:hypothetical protein